MSIEGLHISHHKGVYDVQLASKEIPTWFRAYLGECLKKQNIQHSFNNKKNTCTLYTEKVEVLAEYIDRENYLEYDVCIDLLNACSEAMDFLQAKQLMFVNMDLGDFWKIDNSFVFVNFHKVSPMKDGHIIESGPVSLHKFTPPELLVGGGEVDISSTYYNIANILAYVSCQVYVTGNASDKIQKQLGIIYYTKLYWFLMRCLEPEPSLRRYLFV